jgi:hypothetical protein
MQSRLCSNYDGFHPGTREKHKSYKPWSIGCRRLYLCQSNHEITTACRCTIRPPVYARPTHAPTSHSKKSTPTNRSHTPKHHSLRQKQRPHAISSISSHISVQHLLLYSRSTRKSKPESSHPMQIPKTPIKLHSHPRSLLKLRSKHSMRSNRAAVVLGSEVAALGRYERVPLGEESDSCSTGSLVKLFALCSSAGR